MTIFSTMTRFRAITFAGLAISTAAILVQIASGADYPKVPPGPIILAVAALLVATLRFRWMPLIAGVVAGMILLGGFIAPEARENLTDPGNAGIFIGTAVQLPALAVALIAGAYASFRSE